jgi:hypothetical protein
MATAVIPVSPKQVESTSVSGIEFEERLTHVIAAGRVQLDDELTRLRSLGIIDEQGDLLKTDLPADMQPGSERDFGG